MANKKTDAIMEESDTISTKDTETEMNLLDLHHKVLFERYSNADFAILVFDSSN